MATDVKLSDVLFRWPVIDRMTAGDHRFNYVITPSVYHEVEQTQNLDGVTIQRAILDTNGLALGNRSDFQVGNVLEAVKVRRAYVSSLLAACRNNISPQMIQELDDQTHHSAYALDAIGRLDTKGFKHNLSSSCNEPRFKQEIPFEQFISRVIIELGHGAHRQTAYDNLEYYVFEKPFDSDKVKWIQDLILVHEIACEQSFSPKDRLKILEIFDEEAQKDPRLLKALEYFKLDINQLINNILFNPEFMTMVNIGTFDS